MQLQASIHYVSARQDQTGVNEPIRLLKQLISSMLSAVTLSEPVQTNPDIRKHQTSLCINLANSNLILGCNPDDDLLPPRDDRLNAVSNVLAFSKRDSHLVNL